MATTEDLLLVLAGTHKHLLRYDMFTFTYRDKYPEIHQYFPEGQPTTILGKVVRTYILEDGVKCYISPEIEDLLASGSNWMHSGASVHQNAFELLQWVQDKWRRSLTAIIARGQEVLCSYVLTINTNYFYAAHKGSYLQRSSTV